MTDSRDDLDDLLKPPGGPPPAALRDDLLRRTGRAVVRARRVRHAARVAGVAAVFLAGGVAGWFARPQRERVVEVAGPERVVSVPVVVPVLVPQGAADPVEPAGPLSATAAELRAEQADDRSEAANLYRAAGDGFLGDQDYANAARCYRLFLAQAGDDGLAPARGDSWLLTSLKNAAFKEKTDVPKIHD